MAKSKTTFPNIRDDMERNFHIQLTDDQIRLYCKGDSLLTKELKDDACDTMFRERLMQSIVNKIIGSDLWWPTNGDDEEYSQKFYETFAAAALRHSIKLGPKWDVMIGPSPEDLLKAKICGQVTALRAIEVAIVRDLSVLLVGPRGGGKQFLTEAFPEANIRWMHSCPCGSLGSIVRECNCDPARRTRYLNVMRTRAHLSDIVLEIPLLPYTQMGQPAGPDFAEKFHARLIRAKEFGSNLKKERSLEESARRTEEMAVRRLSLPKSVVDRIHQVANAIADLDGSPVIKAKHIAEAALYRGPHWMRGE